MQQVPGMHTARPNELLYIVVVHKNEDGSTTVETVNSPTSQDLEDLFDRFNLPVIYTMGLVAARDPKSYCVLIDTEKYHEHLVEKGYRIELPHRRRDG